MMIQPPQLWKKISAFFLKFAPEAAKDEMAPTHWKEKVLYLLVLLSLLVGSLMLVLGTPSNIKNEYWMVCLASVVCYLGGLALFVFPNIAYVVRAGMACGLIYFLGIASILDMNPFLAPREYLFTFSILASILLGWWGAIISVSMNLITWLAVGVLLKFRFWMNILGAGEALFYWHLASMDLLFINIASTILITLFFIRISKSDQTAKSFSQQMLKEGQKIVQANQQLAAQIVERQAVTMALRESEKKYRSILESIKDAYFETDLKGSITFFNRAFQHQLGYAEDELVGMNYRNFADDRNSEKLFHAFNQIFTTHKPSSLDVQILSNTKKVSTVSILASLKKDKNGGLIGFQGLARDITENKAMENQLRQDQKMEAIGTLAGGVAHDLNNILSGVVSYPQLLLMELENGHPLKKPIETIQKSGENAVAIVQDLLALARRDVATKHVVNLNAIILECVRSKEFKAFKSFHPNVQIETNLDRTLLNIIGSHEHLSKTIMNLISNGIEAITGKGKVLLSTRNQYIEAGMSLNCSHIKEGDCVELSIRDTGDGIPAEDLDKIFEPFFPKKELGRSGSGLGMAVVWGIVKDHGGHIDVQSVADEGTTYTIYFPVSRKSASNRAATISIEPLKGNGERILVVDDVQTQREIATAMLEKLGYEANVVGSGEQAVEYLKTNHADLLVLDMIMRPGIDGLETYQRVIATHPGQKAIIASGFSETEQVKEAQRLGAGQYIRKPYCLESIAAAIKAELSK